MLSRRTSNVPARVRLAIIEAVEDRRLMSVTSLTLYDAVNDTPYGTLTQNQKVSFAQLNTSGITIKAETGGNVGNVGSVRWALNGKANDATENYAPFAIGGDAAGGADLLPWATPGPGTHTVKATAYAGKNGTGKVLGSVTRTFTVLDSPRSPTPTPVPNLAAPTLSINDVSGAEGNSGTKNLTFTVIRTGSTSASSTVRWSTQNGTAGEGDYQVASGTLSFAPGQASKSVAVQLKGDTKVESNEVFRVNLSAASGATIADGQGLGTIVNDDGVTTPTPTPTPVRQDIRDITWTRNAPRSPEPKTEAGVIQVGSKVYSIGGFTSKGGSATVFPLTRKVYAYDMATRKYTTLASLPPAAAGNHSGIATDGANIYVVAGQVENTYGRGTNTVWKYNIASNKWSQMPSLPAVRFGGSAFVAGGKLHFVGGTTADRTTVSGAHWALDLSNPGAGWKARKAIPLAGDHISDATINGKVYIFGGEHGHHGTNPKHHAGYVQHNYTFEYDPAKDAWTRKANLPVAISHVEGSTLVIGGKAVLIGGLLTGGGENTTNRVQVYDPVTNTWKTLMTRYPKRVIGAVAGYWNGKIYMTEGYSPDTTDRQAGFEGTVKFG